MKRFISIVLTFALLFGIIAMPASAISAKAPANTVDAAETDYNGYPFILVRGMEISLLVHKLGTAEEEPAFRGINAGELIFKLLKAIANGIVHWNIDYFVDDVIDYVDKILGLLACNKDGTSKYDVSVQEYPLALSNYPEFVNSLTDDNEWGILKTACEKYGSKNVYYYMYDWRLDPFMHADKINDMVKRALEDSGKDKVNIVCASMGGIMTESYLYKYGTQDVNRVIFLSSTFCGTYVTTDLFAGKAVIEPDALYNFVYQKLGGSNAVIGLLYRGLEKIGSFERIANLGNKLIAKIKDKVYDEFLSPVFGTMPSLWALCLPDGYDEDIEFMFGGKEDEYADLIALTEEYQKMAAARNEFLQEDEDFFIDIIASYGTANIPVYLRGGENGDGTLESSPMLGFAKVARTGQTLGDGYKGQRVSPDNVCDLSDVLYPENTWAISGSPHVACHYGTDYSDFVFWILSCEGRVTVDTNPKYPQFMKSSDKMELELYK